MCRCTLSSLPEMWLTFIHRSTVSNMTAFLRVMAWRRTGISHLIQMRMHLCRICQQKGDHSVAIMQATFTCSSMRMVIFWFKLDRALFPWVQSTISQHWSIYWFGTYQATSHYLNQRCHSLFAYICITRPQWFKSVISSTLGFLVISQYFHLTPIDVTVLEGRLKIY